MASLRALACTALICAVSACGLEKEGGLADFGDAALGRGGQSGGLGGASSLGGSAGSSGVGGGSGGTAGASGVGGTSGGSGGVAGTSGTGGVATGGTGGAVTGGTGGVVTGGTGGAVTGGTGGVVTGGTGGTGGVATGGTGGVGGTPPTCTSLYSSVKGVTQVCSGGGAGECQLAVNTTSPNGQSCAAICGSAGGECLGYYNNSFSACDYYLFRESCFDTSYLSAVCFCSLGCGGGPPCPLSQSCQSGQCS